MLKIFHTRWSEIIVVGLAEAVVATVATVTFKLFIEQTAIRDLGIVAMWIAAILGGFVYLARFNARGASVDPSLPVNEPGRIVDQLAPSPEVESLQAELQRLRADHTLFPDRQALDKDGGMRREVADSSELWVALYAGTFIFGEELLRTRKITRLIVVNPEGQYVAKLAELTNQPVAHLKQNIRATTKEAQDCNVAVRWFDGPLLNCVIGNPDTDRRWARVEVFLPFSPVRPNIKLGSVNGINETIAATYEATWTQSVSPSTLDSELVSLYRTHGLPTRSALLELLEEMFRECFNRNAWPGLTANLFKYDVLQKWHEDTSVLDAALVDNNGSAFADRLDQWIGRYYTIVGLTYQFGRRDIGLINPQMLDRWKTSDSHLWSRMRDLANGIGREHLRIWTNHAPEAQTLLKALGDTPGPETT